MSAETKAAWYQKNKELTKARAVQWAKDNPEKRNSIQRESRHRNVEARRASRKAYRERCPQVVAKQRKSTAKWKREHLENLRATENKKRSRKTEAGGFFSAQEWFILCFAVGFLCLCCGKKKPLEADHVIPVSKGGPSWLWNIQPLCKHCNTSKGDKLIDYRV